MSRQLLLTCDDNCFDFTKNGDKMILSTTKSRDDLTQSKQFVVSMGAAAERAAWYY